MPALSRSPVSRFPETPAPCVCAGCGARFGCGVADAECWCTSRPALRTLRDGAGCLCPACLDTALVAERTALSAQIDAALAAKTMPAGALAGLADLARTVGLCQGTVAPVVERTALLVFAADHGIVEEGVSAYPAQVTRQMLANFQAGGAAVNVFARSNDIALEVIDAGVGRPTANFARGPAMSEDDAQALIARGAEHARAAIERHGAQAIGLGEMGIGNTSSAAALTARLLGRPAADCVGAGTGLDGPRLAHKRAVIEAALTRHAHARTPLAALAAMGGFEIAMMVGAIEAAVVRGCVVVIDGYVVTAALLVAWRRNPRVLDGCVFAHLSAEPGHRHALAALRARPLLDLGMRLGEGSGAALAMPLLRAAARMLTEMASFEQAGVSRATGA
ncbi:MAG: nicotinate-nucleotide--dimethylbenzimidazole phosphoribosyltransferase [Burkholderiaceae bacterium]|nr:nicotinate-nucleotide--dimethylbenzimidazole phosphoribosyltransferase [Burkholderiaceae bacterium]